jgi:hypothetical protein
MSELTNFDSPEAEAAYWKAKYEKTSEKKTELQQKVDQSPNTCKPPPFTIILLIVFSAIFLWQSNTLYFDFLNPFYFVILIFGFAFLILFFEL